MFSRRTLWESSSNRLTELLEARRASGLRVIDLTVSNPTLCGFDYPEKRILDALSGPESLKYRPDPHGLEPARESIAAFYRARGVEVPIEDIFITASTSESYSHLFRLLCNPGDSVVIPTPSYPLFDYLAGINDVGTQYYRLERGARWSLDADSLRKAMIRTAKAVLAVDPHNPTGMFLSPDESRAMASIAAAHGAAIIVDEVFGEYRFDGAPVAARPAEQPAGLAFLLNGLSKLAALPQLKIGWIALRGDRRLRDAARARLEILNDIFLSAGTPAQAGLPELIEAGAGVRGQVLDRVRGNFAALRGALDGVAGCSVLPCEGGWNAVVRLPAGLGDDECATGLLDEAGVYCYPGYFFDFEEDDVMVVSLLPPAMEFREGAEAMAGWIVTNSGRPA